MSFADEFDTLSLRNGNSGVWDSNFWWGGENGSTLADNGEKQWYIDHAYGPTRSVKPFSVDDGVLTITAARAPEAIRPYINNYEYTSGLLNTGETFFQTYGYFEMRADMPDNHGVWPAFWLLPKDGSWPPEIDVVEMRGQDPNTVHVAAHSNEIGSRTTVGSAVSVPGTEGFHTYGLLWTEEDLVWYFDDVEVFRADTPDDMHEPMYMLVNLAVGGMAGTPSDKLATPAEMQIDFIRAYQLDDVPSSANPGPLASLVDAHPEAFYGVAAIYETLLGGVPNKAGFTYVIGNAVETNYGAFNEVVFNQENVFTNLANSLLKHNQDAAARFTELTYGRSELTDKIGALYANLVPWGSQTQDGFNYLASAEAVQYYEQVAEERGVIDPAIVAMATILNVLLAEDIGLGDALHDLGAAIDDGTAELPESGLTLTPIGTAVGLQFDQDVALVGSAPGAALDFI